MDLENKTSVAVEEEDDEIEYPPFKDDEKLIDKEEEIE